ncbi:hypothetical protein A374_04079 [Fictibacillus macauensis ZFHKF-1]|uniref:Bifunctional metallophosphatase/5'-nucleotidase n=1 Tax=Fictibacillus macauensis ZFHKF-1 TaxID=1196324 RepID=I8UIK0_9BACL|nr:metallophosphoesterase [Fictibacillus macauensis]EIT86720.1 hypothetical protein A374_04079 [Fictibacillus macauensis ZFHKF-1]
MKCRILHTNDIHSNFQAFAQAATVIKEHRKGDTLLLDGGDFADFRSIELQGTDGCAAVELLDALGYDALTIGNNECFGKLDRLQKMANAGKVTFLSNNIHNLDHTPVTGVLPATIRTINGIRFLLTGSSPDQGPFNEGLGITITCYKEALKKVLATYRELYDVCIVLNHIGTQADHELAREIEGIDLILSAHDHQLYETPRMENGVMIHSAGAFGQHVGLIDIEVTTSGVVLLHSATISTATAKKDEQILAVLAANKKKAITRLQKPLSQLAQPLWHDMMEENPMTNLLADGLRDLLNCEFSIIGSGLVNGGCFDTITMKKLIEICPSPLNPTRVTIQGKQLKEALAATLEPTKCLQEARAPGFRGIYAGRLHISGGCVRHNGTELLSFTIGGEEVKDEQWYEVATSDHTERCPVYTMLHHYKNPTYCAEELKDVLRMYATQEKWVKKAYEHRFVLSEQEVVASS